jgi:hypothetical protein
MIPQRIVFVLLSFLCICLTPYAYGAGLISRFHPFVTVKAEYTDNLNLTKTDKTEDIITTVQPGIRFSNMSAKSGMDLEYMLGAVFYGKKTNLNYISHNASLDAKYLTASHVNFYLKESFVQSDDPREHEYFTAPVANRYVVATKTERAVSWRNVVAPTIEYQFGPEDRLGVTYRNNIYRTESAFGENSQENFINPFFSYWFNRRNGISLEYGLTYGEFDRNPDLTGHRGIGRYTYRLSPQYAVFTEHTYSKRTFGFSESLFSTDYDIHEPSIGMQFTIGTHLTASAQVGYFWMKPRTGSGREGLSYKGELTNVPSPTAKGEPVAIAPPTTKDEPATIAPRTTFGLNVQGGYTEDFFTSQNLGFIRYHRLTGYLYHMLDRQVSLGCFGNVEYAEYETLDRRDTIWGVGVMGSYMPLKWLTFALEASHRENQSSIDISTYVENRGMFRITIMY